MQALRNQVVNLLLFGLLNSSVFAEGSLNIFQITQGYNDGPAVPPSPTFTSGSNGSYFGFAFHNGKIGVCWMDNSGTVTSSPPAPVSNIVFAAVQVNSPHDILVGKNVVVSKNLGFNQNNPQIAIDPTNTNYMTICSLNSPFPDQQGYASLGLLVASTSDGGKSWETNFSLQKNHYQQNSKMPLPLGFGEADALIGYDSHGNLFLPYTTTFSPNTDNLFTVGFPFFLNFCVSTDHGKNFKMIKSFDPRIFNLNATTEGRFEQLAIGLDQVCVSGTREFVESPPSAGDLFIFPIEGKGKIGPPVHVLNPTLPNGIAIGNGLGSMAFNPSGGLLVAQTNDASSSAFFQSCSILFTSFLPKGAKEFPLETAFQPFKNVGVGGSAFYPAQPTSGTWPISPTPIVAYVYNAHHFGRAYMAYLDNPHTPSSSCSFSSTAPGGSDTNVFVVYSDDDGKTWSTPFPIPKTNTNTRILAQLAIDQTTGNIGVAWLDAVNDPNNVNVQVFATVIPWDFFD